MRGALEIADHRKRGGGDSDRHPVDEMEGLAGELAELAELGLAAPPQC
jgi:hypothetical protein